MARKKLRKTKSPTYRVLATDHLPLRVKQMIDVKMKTINTGFDAKSKLAGKDGFSYRPLDHLGKVGTLNWNGVEVAVFFNRQVIPVTSDECDPAPRCSIKDPDNAWVRMELLHIKPAKGRSTWFSERETSLSKELEEYKGLCKQKEMELELLKEANVILEQKTTDQLEALQKFRALYRKASEKVRQWAPVIEKLNKKKARKK